MRKKRAKNIEYNANEHVLVLYFEGHQLVSDLWTVEKLWSYMSRAYKDGLDPLDLMLIPQNEYALGRAEVFGMVSERRDKYGR